MHTYMATMYMFMSVGICATLYLKIESVEKKLYSILNNSVQKVSKLSMLLLTPEKGVRPLRFLTRRLIPLNLIGYSMGQRSQVQGAVTDSRQKVGVQSGKIYTLWCGERPARTRTQR